MSQTLLEQIGSRDDADIVVRMRRRDPESMGLLYDRYGKEAYTLALRIVGDVTWAECIVAESMLKCWNKVASYSDTRCGAMGVCLLLTIYANAMDHRRSINARMAERPGKPGTLECEVVIQNWSTYLSPDRLQDVAFGLRDLDPEEATVLNLAFFEGFDAAQLSAHLGRNSVEVEKLIDSALRKLTIVEAE